jgi:hypothetical protein
MTQDERLPDTNLFIAAKYVGMYLKTKGIDLDTEEEVKLLQVFLERFETFQHTHSYVKDGYFFFCGHCKEMTHYTTNPVMGTLFCDSCKERRERQVSEDRQ